MIYPMDPRRMDRRFAAPSRDQDLLIDWQDMKPRLIGRLPKEHMRAVILFYILGLPLWRTSRHLGGTFTQTRKLLHTAEAMLRMLARKRYPEYFQNGNGHD